MKGLMVVLLFSCIIFACLDFGFALKCYDCQSTKGSDKDCEDHPEKVKTTECPSGSDACQILEAKDGNGILRTCSAKKVCDLIEDAVKDTVKRCVTCTSDLCNSGFVPGYSTSLMVSIGFFVLMKLFT